MPTENAGFLPDVIQDTASTNAMAESFNRRVETVLNELGETARSYAESQLEPLLESVTDEEQLLSTVRSSKDGKLRATACWLLARTDIHGAFSALGAALESSSVSVRTAATEGLGLTRKAEGASLLTRMLSDPSSKVRSAAALSLPLCASTDVSEQLGVVLKNKSEKSAVRAHAAEALALSPSLNAIRFLEEALIDPSKEVQFWSAYALGEIGDIGSKAALEKASKLASGRVRKWGSVKREMQEAINQIGARLGLKGQE